MTELSAKFWYGVFGRRENDAIVKAVLVDSLNSDSKMFPAVDLRKTLCDAMHRRSLPEILHCMDLIKEEEYNGGTAVIYAERLVAELTTLESQALALEDAAKSEKDIHVVEAFLLSCAKLGYTGEHMFKAIQMRDRLVRLASKADKEVL